MVIENYFFYSTLDYHFGAEGAGEGGAVDCRSHRSISSSFENSRFLCVQAKTFVEVDALAYVVIAALAPALIAIC